MKYFQKYSLFVCLFYLPVVLAIFFLKQVWFIWKDGTSIEKCLHQISLWASY